MIVAALALAAAQVAVPSATGLSVDERIEALAAREARNSGRIEDAIYADPVMRAEVRRVGFATGCVAVGVIGREVAARHAEALAPRIAAAIRTVIPAQRVAEASAVSFLAMPLTAYHGRVGAELERSAAGALAAAREDMRRTFLARTGVMPPASDPAANAITPRADIAAALGIQGDWDLDKPAQMRMACADQRIRPQLRPTITTGEKG